MSAHPADFWAIDLAVEERTPVSILREQAALLGEKTQHMLRGEVVSNAKGQSLKHRFFITVPALDDYRYELLWVEHSLDLYPINAWFNNSVSSIGSEESFVGWLREALSSEQTAKIVRTLLSQART